MSFKSIISRDYKSDVLFLFLILPLGIPAFFHPGSTLEFRIVLSSFELLFVTVFAFYYLRKEAVFYLPKTGMILIIAWAVWACFAVFFSDHPVASILRQWEWFCKVLFAFSLWAYLKDRQYMLNLLHCMILIGVFLVCTGFGVFWYLLPDPSRYNWVTDIPHFANIRHFAYYLAVGLTLCTYLMFNHKKGNITRIITTFLMLSVLWGFLLWSGSRGGIVASGIGGIFTGLFLVKKKKKFFIILILSILLGFIGSLFFQVDHTSLGAANAIKRTSIGARILIWTEALHDVKGSLLFGLGPDSFRFFPRLRNGFIQPHNALVQGILEWGIPGTIMFILLLFMLMYKGFVRIVIQKQTYFYGIKSTALALTVAYLCFGFVDGVYYHALPLTLLAYAFAVISLPGAKKNAIGVSNRYIPVTRMTLRVLTTILLMVFCLQFAVSQTIKSERIPDPFSVKGRLVRFFPSETCGLERWVMDWKKTYPKVALQASIRFARASSLSYVFWRVASIISAEQGENNLAMQMAENAIQNSYGKNRDQLIMEFQRYGITSGR